MPFQAIPSDSKRFLQEHLDARSAAQSAVATWAGLVGDSPSWMAATWAPLHVLAQRLATCSPCLSGVRDSQSHSPCILIILAATSTWKFWAWIVRLLGHSDSDAQETEVVSYLLASNPPLNFHPRGSKGELLLERLKPGFGFPSPWQLAGPSELHQLQLWYLAQTCHWLSLVTSYCIAMDKKIEQHRRYRNV